MTRVSLAIPGGSVFPLSHTGKTPANITCEFWWYLRYWNEHFNMTWSQYKEKVGSDSLYILTLRLVPYGRAEKLTPPESGKIARETQKCRVFKKTPSLLLKERLNDAILCNNDVYMKPCMGPNMAPYMGPNMAPYMGLRNTPLHGGGYCVFSNEVIMFLCT